MKCYPEYKESGVEWIGEIPGHWETKAVWMMFRLGRGRVISNEEMGAHPGRYPVYSSQTEDEGVMGYIDTYDFDGDYITWTTDGAKAGTVFYRTGQFNCTNVCGTLLPRNQNLDLRFFHHALNIVTSRFVRYDINPKLMNNVMAKIRVQVPPAAEQRAIADFLDRKTGQIDELIRIKERRIELLQEQRTALINQAVTKGLDLNVEMKSSGVEWIGEIPKHWTISKVKHEFESLDNLRIPLNSETRGNMKLKIYDYYGASGVIDKVENCIFDEPLILIGEDGANLYLRSTPLAFKATGKYWVNNHAHVLRPKHGNIDYLTNMLESLDYIHYITGAAQPKLTSDNLMNITVITPPPLEQDRIANFLDRKAGQIDQLITAEQRKIELLKEYRQSLISEAVTGKIDVRSEV